jgi:hypothetical protein
VDEGHRLNRVVIGGGWRYKSIPAANITGKKLLGLSEGDVCDRVGRWNTLVPPSTPYDYPVQPVAFIHCKKRPGHWRLLLDNEDLFAPRLQNVLMIPDIISAVANNKMAVSIAVSYLAHEIYKERGEVRGLQLDTISAADLSALAKGHYPLYRVTSITYWKQGSHTEEIHKLLAFLDSYIEKNSIKLLFVPASELRKTGWLFKDEELIAPPEEHD